MITPEELNKMTFGQAFRCDEKLLRCIEVVKKTRRHCDRCFFKVYPLPFCFEIECSDRIFIDASIPSIIEVDE
jgi:hypothetical protein